MSGSVEAPADPGALPEDTVDEGVATGTDALDLAVDSGATFVVASDRSSDMPQEAIASAPATTPMPPRQMRIVTTSNVGVL